MEDIIEQRRQKVQKLLEVGVYPYGRKFVTTGSISYYLEHFQENQSVSIAGRITAYRGHGKVVFADLQDFTGKIQVYARKDSIGEKKFSLFKLLDVGDIIGVNGKLFKTHTQELTIVLEDFQYLSKSLRPLPEKWHGLKDIELRYRQRYLDLLVNKSVRDVFIKRSKIISKLREFLNTRGFLEVETPMMQSVPGGAAARPFITHHTALNTDLYLRIAPELYLKRLLVGGFEKIYEMNRNFRNEGISKIHNPEFTMLEVYAIYEDYEYMMDLAEQLITVIARDVLGGLKIQQKNGTIIDLRPPWKRRSMYGIIFDYTGVDLGKANPKEFRKIAGDMGIQLDDKAAPETIIDKIFKEKVEKKLTQPIFVTDYPINLCPLSKSKKDDPSYAERFELFIAGYELANAYSELNDPDEQRRRFSRQLADVSEGARRLDEDFITALEYAMPPAGGLGIGIDRLVMLITGMDSIRDVILFPQLRPVE